MEFPNQTFSCDLLSYNSLDFVIPELGWEGYIYKSNSTKQTDSGPP